MQPTQRHDVPPTAPLADAVRRVQATEWAELMPRPQRLAEHAQRAEAALLRPALPRAAAAVDTPADQPRPAAWQGPLHPAEPGPWRAR